MLQPTEERVPAQTSGGLNEAIRREAMAKVGECAARPERIAARLGELDR